MSESLLGTDGEGGFEGRREVGTSASKARWEKTVCEGQQR